MFKYKWIFLFTTSLFLILTFILGYYAYYTPDLMLIYVGVVMIAVFLFVITLWFVYYMEYYLQKEGYVTLSEKQRLTIRDESLKTSIREGILSKQDKRNLKLKQQKEKERIMIINNKNLI